jgi:hypothetical protein
MLINIYISCIYETFKFDVNIQNKNFLLCLTKPFQLKDLLIKNFK